MNRTRLLLGQDAEKPASARVAVFGVGGVGGYVAGFLARAGVGHIALIDGDTVSASNLNRQIIALTSTIGQKKTQVCARRLKDINPDLEVEEFDLFYTQDTPFDFSRYDLIADCIDTVTSKVALIKACSGVVPVISCMGTGNKRSTNFELADIYSTSVCPLARVMRRLLKQANIPSLLVVYSKEQPSGGVIEEGGRHAPASISYVPAAAAAKIAESAIKLLLSKNQAE